MATKPKIKLRAAAQLKSHESPKTIEHQPNPVWDVDKLATLPDPNFKPRKQQISIRLDSDVLSWYQQQPGKYQQLINKACRVYKALIEESFQHEKVHTD